MANLTDEIVKVVAKKAKIPEAAAKIAVDTVVSTLAKKLPSSVGGVLESFIGGSGSASASKGKSSKSKKDESLLGDISDIAGKFLGKK
ncbi:MAG: hypothetical protein FWF73_04835 [Spirochaetes bacterium]|nr:hypothetical protein [Spirochaetota bacterium]